MNKINKDLIDKVRDTLRPYLDECGVKLGIVIKLGNATYDLDGSDGHIKLELHRLTPEGALEIHKEAAHRYRVEAEGLGLDPEWIGKELQNSAGDSYILLGILEKHRVPRNRVVISRVSDCVVFHVSVSSLSTYTLKCK